MFGADNQQGRPGLVPEPSETICQAPALEYVQVKI